MLIRTVKIRRRRLPHWTTDGGTYFVTFRLADAMSSSLMRRIAEQRNRHLNGDRILDRGYGSCWLRNVRVARVVDDAFRTFSAGVVHAWTIMPNHVHVALRLAMSVDLDEVFQRIKGRTARAANQILGRTGSFWQGENYDSLLHDQHQLNRAIQYIEANPVKAGLAGWPWVTVLDRTFLF